MTRWKRNYLIKTLKLVVRVFRNTKILWKTHLQFKIELCNFIPVVLRFHFDVIMVPALILTFCVMGKKIAEIILMKPTQTAHLQTVGLHVGEYKINEVGEYIFKWSAYLAKKVQFYTIQIFEINPWCLFTKN